MPPATKTTQVVYLTAKNVERTQGISEGDRPARFLRKSLTDRFGRLRVGRTTMVS